MFIGEVYGKLVYLLDSKCFIIAVCMVLCGNICSSGFYSDGFHVRGAEWRGKKRPVVEKSSRPGQRTPKCKPLSC